MKTEFKSIAYLYIGCEMILPKSMRIAVLKGVEIEDNDILLHDGMGWKYYSIFKFKPILRPLSDMTDAETEKYNRFLDDMETSCEQCEAQRTAYLLSKHFDLFGLIESGQAIDATTLKTA